MTEPIFQILTKKRKKIQNSKENSKASYNQLLQDYLSRSYGYYLQLFLKKTIQNAQEKYEHLRPFPLRKLLRQIIKRYLMSDLQLIFFTHFANLHQWNYKHSLIQQSICQNENNIQLNQINKFKLFLSLIAFFVKSYVGPKNEILELIDFHNQNLPCFLEIYKIWVQNNPKKLFQISPRQLNQIYSQYSRNCGQKVEKKDFNQMVDKILDLSTTYTMMSCKEKDNKGKQNEKQLKYKKISQKQMIQSPQKRSLRFFESNIYEPSMRWDFSDLRQSKKQSIIIAGLSSLGQKVERKQSMAQQKVEKGNPPKKISLNKKRKQNKDEVNDVAKAFFGGKELNLQIENMKKSDMNNKDIIPSNFLDLNLNSSRIESIPFNYRNTSNIFGHSALL